MMKTIKLMDQVRTAIRYKHYSIRTEKSYTHWVKRYILFHNKRHPREMGEIEVMQFINSLVTRGQVTASTQNQALCAILFLYREVIKSDIKWIDNIEWSKKPKRLPVVFTADEVARILVLLDGTHWLMASVIYGSGLRLQECLRLRIQDIDFGYRQIIIRDGKGQKDRITILPSSLESAIIKQVEKVKVIHYKDMENGIGSVYLPNALMALDAESNSKIFFPVVPSSFILTKTVPLPHSVNP